MRGITGTIDIIWTTGDTQIRRVNNVTASSNINSTSVYSNSFVIPSVNIGDDGSVYQCEVLIYSMLSTAAKKDYILEIPGTYINTFICVKQRYIRILHTFYITK